MDLSALASAVAAAASAVAAFLSWRSERFSSEAQALLSAQAIRAAIFERRFAVYVEVQDFMSPWMRDGHPDLVRLPQLISAWDRSRYLFDPEVTSFIRGIWLDAVQIEHDRPIINEEMEGDRQKAIEFKYACLRKYFDNEGDYSDLFYRTFAKDLSIPPPLAPISNRQ
ncbi:hypothetical protein [Hyphomicrobium sp.]|uniref:hypothetical protein n=1 Tax=Hyphomicrobium sp. TaxID=82 RepID=UPI000FAE2E9F|nr:hypothetical protein [Hyphomicrobium sp.]RUP08289.1 MAG: hypothetical protein EKK38_15515 [Hyphomicrobium sp.]